MSRFACVSIAFALSASSVQAGADLFGSWTGTVPDLPRPTALAWGTDGLWIATADDHRVRCLTLAEPAAGSAQREAPVAPAFAEPVERVSIGGHGRADGRFRHPAGVALAAGEVFVTDRDNHRVQVFDRDGGWRRSFGTAGSGPGELFQPWGLATDGQRVAVCDRGNHRVALFTVAGEPLGTLGDHGSEPGRLIGPSAVALTADGRVVVCDRSNDRIQVFAADGDVERTFGLHGFSPGALSAPTGLALAGERLWIADRDNHRIGVFSLTGRWIGAWGLHAIRPREGAGRLHYPIGIALRPDGSRAAVLEGRADRVQLFAPGPGSAAGSTGGAASDPGPSVSSTPHFGAGGGADEGLLCVLQPEAHAVLVHDLRLGDPVEVAQVGSFGSGPGELRHPCDVLVKGLRQRFWVSDADNRRLVLFELPRDRAAPLRQITRSAVFVKALDFAAPALRARLGLPAVVWPGSLAGDDEGRVYVADRRNGCVLSFDGRMSFEGTLGRPGAIERPAGLAVDPAGRVLVVDAARRQVLVFDPARPEEPVLRSPEPDPSEPLLVAPYGVALDPAGRVLVSDVARHALVRFDAELAFERVLGSAGLEADRYFKPRDLFAVGEHELCVVDQGNHRLQFLDADGRSVSVFGARLFTRPARRTR